MKGPGESQAPSSFPFDLLLANKCRSRDLVVKAALVRVPDQRGNGDSQKCGTHHGTPQPHPATVDGNDTQPDDAVADAGTDRGDEDDLQDHKNDEVGCGIVAKKDRRDADGDGPIDGETE